MHNLEACSGVSLITQFNLPLGTKKITLHASSRQITVNNLYIMTAFCQQAPLLVSSLGLDHFWPSGNFPPGVVSRKGV
jgi:hypothetical protein